MTLHDEKLDEKFFSVQIQSKNKTISFNKSNNGLKSKKGVSGYLFPNEKRTILDRHFCRKCFRSHKVITK